MSRCEGRRKALDAIANAGCIGRVEEGGFKGDGDGGVAHVGKDAKGVLDAMVSEAVGVVAEFLSTLWRSVLSRLASYTDGIDITSLGGGV